MNITKKDQFVAINVNLLNQLSKENGKKLKPAGHVIVSVIMSYFPHMFPTIKTIAKQSGLHRQTVFKHLKILEELKILKRYKRLGTSNLYEINPAVLLRKQVERAKQAIDFLRLKWENRKRRTSPPHVSCTNSMNTNQNNVYNQSFFKEISNLKQFLRPMPV